MNTSETNKLIVDFMEEPMLGEGVYTILNSQTGETEFLETSELRYDKSWDWLMPVIQKVYDEVGPKIDGMNGMNENLIGDISTAILDGNIEEAYTAVVFSIELYNEIKQNG